MSNQTSMHVATPGPGQMNMYESSETGQNHNVGLHTNNVCGTKPSVLYSNQFAPDLVTSKSMYGCAVSEPPYLATNMSSVMPACGACNGCSKQWNMNVFGLRPVSAPAFACGTPMNVGSNSYGISDTNNASNPRAALQLGVNPLTTVGVGNSNSPSRYQYGATMKLKEDLRANMAHACTSGSPAECKTAAVQAQNLDQTVASYGMVLPTSFLPDASEFYGTFGGPRPGGF